MSNIAFIGCPGTYGHTNPTLGLVAELVKHGEIVYYYSTENFRVALESTGTIFCLYPERNEHLNKTKVENSYDNYFDKFIAERIEAINYNKEYEDFVMQDLEGKNIHFLIFDESAEWGKNVAIKKNIPSICSITKFAYCDEILYKYSDMFLDKILKIPKKMIESQNKKDIIMKIQKTLKIIGKKHELTNFDLSNFLSNKAEMNIVYTSKQFQINAEKFDNSYSFIGYSIANRKYENYGFEINPKNKKIVYISMGTVESNLELIQKCINTFANTQYYVIMSAGRLFDKLSLQQLPDNIIVRSFVDQIDILKQSDIFITHGGMNSTNEALLYSVPLIVFPQRGDQFIVSKRVEELGVGMNLSDKEISNENLFHITEKIINDTKIKKNCQMLSRSLAQSGGYKKGVDDIFAFKKRKGL